MESAKTTQPNSEQTEEQGRAIARGMDEINVQKQKNMVKEGRRMKSMLKNAAEKVLFK